MKLPFLRSSSQKLAVRLPARRFIWLSLLAACACAAPLTAATFQQLPIDGAAGVSAFSADASTVVGTRSAIFSSVAFRANGGTVTFLPLLGGARSSAVAVSADGSVIAGSSTSHTTTERQAVRWVNGAISALGLPADWTSSHAAAISRMAP